MDADVLLWARARAFFGCTSVNALIRTFLDEYAAVPESWRNGLPPPWTPENRIRPVMDPEGAGRLVAGADVGTDSALEAIAEATRSRQG